MASVCDKCVFPFIYNNNTYNKCTWDYFHRPSCITNSSLDPQECTNDCPTENKICSECQFPFEYMGRNYSKCTSYNWRSKDYEHNLDVNGVLSWCITNKSEFNTHSGWKYCSSECPRYMNETDYERYMKVSLVSALIILLFSSLVIAMIVRCLYKKYDNRANTYRSNKGIQCKSRFDGNTEDLGFIQLVEVKTRNKAKDRLTRTQLHSKDTRVNDDPAASWDGTDVGNDTENSIALCAMPHPNISTEYTPTYHRFKILIDNKIGSGYFGVVYRARKVKADSKKCNKNCCDETEVVVKTFTTNTDSQQKTMLLNEIELLGNLQYHFNVIRMLGHCTTNLITKDKVWLVLEYCQGGDLKQLLTKNKNKFLDGYRNGWIKRRNLLKWSYQVSKGMQHLAQHRIMHGDLAARNILINEYVYNGATHLIAKISGFGMSTRLYDNIFYQNLARSEKSYKWMAMEFVKFGYFTITSDVWSYGVTFWEILALGEEPYSDLSVDDLTKSLIDGHRLECPVNVNGSIEYDFLGLFNKVSSMCFVDDPTERKTFCDVVGVLEAELSQEECDTYKKMANLA